LEKDSIETSTIIRNIQETTQPTPFCSAEIALVKTTIDEDIKLYILQKMLHKIIKCWASTASLAPVGEMVFF
jgi:hypothetical protein